LGGGARACGRKPKKQAGGCPFLPAPATVRQPAAKNAGC